MFSPDIMIVGAGPVGCMVARLAAEDGLFVWVVESRDHIGGNCYDSRHESGILIHHYGPHYFRTNNDALLTYLSRFTDWIPGNYIVKSMIDNVLYPFPINLDTLEIFFNRRFSEEEAKSFLELRREKIDNPENSEELALSWIGRELYDAFYYGYTLKQWGRHPRELSPSVIGRIPVRLNRDHRYVDHKHQVMPKNGYTSLFSRMLDHPNIHISLQTKYDEIHKQKSRHKILVYTGAVDEYYNYCLGRLPWRSLRFEFTKENKDYVQPCVQINYPNEYSYTRTVEIKHVTQDVSSSTIISYEYPTVEGQPFYPIPFHDAIALFQEYQKMSEVEKIESGVFFAGRLAEYRYLNMDHALERGEEVYKEIRTRYG